MTSGCTEFVESAEEILGKRKMNQTLLANHSTLLDLLEIPQLMDTYVLQMIIKVNLRIVSLYMVEILARHFTCA